MFNRNEITDTTPARVHYPWHELEEYLPDGGMWGILPPPEHQEHIDAAEKLMVNTNLFRDAMLRAVDEWPKSCSVALTTPGLNKRAWIGHAGTYLATGATEDLTRLAWHRLDPVEQWSANDAADQAIAAWHRGTQWTLF